MCSKKGTIHEVGTLRDGISQETFKAKENCPPTSQPRNVPDHENPIIFCALKNIDLMQLAAGVNTYMDATRGAARWAMERRGAMVIVLIVNRLTGRTTAKGCR